MNIKKSLLIGLSLFILLFFFACSTEEELETGSLEQEQSEEGGTVTIGTTGEPVKLNPIYAGDSASEDINGLVFDGLITFDKEMEVEGELATDWEISDDGLTYTFDINEDVLFHDGEKLTAEDVVFTYEKFIHDDYTGPRSNEFIYLEKITALDDYTVEFTLSEVDARFLSNLHYGILPKHLLKDIPDRDLESDDFTRNPVGSGPFKFDEWEDSSNVKVVSFEDYYQGKPKLERIVFLIVPDQNALMARFEAGEIDLMDVPGTLVDNLDHWEEEGIAEKHTTLSLGFSYLGYNNDMEIFSDKKTRQALSHALDREEMVEAVLQGEGEVAHAPISPLSWAYPEDVTTFDYDPERARELLAEAGWEAGEDGILERDGERFSFQLMTNQGNQVREDLVVIIQSQFAKVGVEAVPELREWSSFIETPDAEFEAFILGWGLPIDPDPTRYWHSSYTEADKGGNNNVMYSREDLDELIEQNMKIVDQDERQELLEHIYAEIIEDQPNTFLFYENDIIATSPQLKGFEQHPQNKLYSVKDWYLEDE